MTPDVRSGARHRCYPPPSLCWLCCLFGGVVRGDTLLLILQDKLQLFEVELFRTRPVAVAQIGDTPASRLSAAISRFCATDQRRRRSPRVITSTR